MTGGRFRTVALVAARDRADTVGPTVVALRGLDGVDDVLVVDDGSTDGTAEVARAAGARVLRLPVNRGKGGAVAAGVEATPEADLYLLVDADVGEGAAAAAALLEPVLAGEADLTVGVLPGAGGRGGFGLVRDLARAGITRACGFRPEAPLSGQRAVRAPLLRRLELASRFGLETAFTIDAVRAGARVVEVPVVMGHRHTGRTLAGFAHRAGQGRDILRALWPRLTTARTRLTLLAAALVVAVVAATWSGSRATPANVGAAGPARRVLVVGVQGLTFDDLRAGAAPNVSRLADTGALGALSVRTLSARPSAAEGWATLGAGSRVRALEPAGDAVDAGAVGEAGAGVVVRGQAATRAANEGRHLPTLPGALGDALHAAGRRTAVVGAADTDRPHRPVAVALADRRGRVDAGTVSDPGLLVADPTAPFGRRADTDAVVRRTVEALQQADVVVVDPGDLERAAAAGSGRQEALARTDDLVGRLAADLPPGTLVLVAAVRPPTREWRLTPVVAAGAGVVPGYLYSPSTKRLGLVTLTDVAPSVLAAVGVPVPSALIGHPLRYTPQPADRDRLRELDRLATYRERIYFPIALSYIAVQAAVYLLAMAVLARRRSQSRWGTTVRAAAVAVAAFPLATFLFRALPGAPGLGPAGGAAMLGAITLAITGLALRARRHPLAPLAWVMGATAWLLVLDVATGARLQVASILGYSPHTAARFFGLGNTAFAVLAGTALLAAVIHVAHAPRFRDALAGAAAFLLLVVVVDGAPPLGNDVGGILTLVPVFGLTLYVLSGRKLSWRAVGIAVGAAVAVLAVAAVVDVLRPPDARTHLGRVVADTWNDGEDSLLTTVARKAEANVRVLRSSVWTWTVPIIAVFMLYLLAWRRMGRTLLPVGSPLRVGLQAALAAGLLGFAVNDSGVVVTALVLTYVGPFLAVLALTGERSAPSVSAPTPVGVPR